MKYLFFLILSLSLFSCKFECQTCDVKVESNMEAMEASCNGYNPNADSMLVISDYTVEICNESEFERLKDSEGKRIEIFCTSGIFGFNIGTEITTVNCKPIN